MDTIVSAVFTGKDGSLGYRTNEKYDLIVQSAPLFGIPGAQIIVSRLDGSGRCPYRNIITFLQNWDNIERSWIQARRYP